MNSILTKLLIVCEELEYSIIHFIVSPAYYDAPIATIKDNKGNTTTIYYDKESDSWNE